MTESEKIDESLYSRQLYVIGQDAMRKMQASNILISGLGGCGVEISKNIILAGVKSVTLHDTALATHADLSSQYFLSEADIGKNRALSSLPHLSQLNSYVKVSTSTDPLDNSFLKKFQVVVLTDCSRKKQLEIGKFCHEHDIHLIVAETRGLFGKIFCDFGARFRVVDVNGQSPKTARVSFISNDINGIVTTTDDQRHDLEDGAVVSFSEVKGMSEINGKEFRIITIGPYSFSIGDTRSFGKYTDGGIVKEIKAEKMLTFKSIDQAEEEPNFEISDYTKMTDNDIIHLAFQSFDEFKAKNNGQTPKPWNISDADAFVKIAKDINAKKKQRIENLNENLLKLFSYVSTGNLCPMVSVIGGIAAQEVMKACTGKFHPIGQYLYFDCRECLAENDFETRPNNNPVSKENSRYQSQIAVFGEKFQEKLGNLKCFLVGSGALGCEYLKNLAMMGISAGQNGLTTVTDMDTIEKSNLNRQFLFRSWDIQKPKAEVSIKAAKKMNPNFKAVANLNRVGPETENVFTDDFFNSLDVVCNALDNIAARLYIDSRCITSKKALIESGTLGTDGNVQVIIPHLTETYGSSRDPPEQSIPLCTLKMFPNAIEHTLQWARDAFEGLFHNSAMNAKTFLKDPKSFLDDLSKQQENQRLETLETLEKLLVKEKIKTFEDCCRWARANWEENFHDLIVQLLAYFPPDHQTTTGQPFWSGLKRCPHFLLFDPNSQLNIDYIYAAANLKAQMHGIEQVRNREQVAEIVKSIKFQSNFAPKQTHKPKEKVDGTVQEDNEVLNDEDEERLKKLIDLFGKYNTEKDKNQILVPLEFEKDDDTNFHIDFITACSNLRAQNYDIPPTDRYNSKLIAGKIIPAIATTTSVIVGLDCIELYKIVQGHKKIEKYRNSYISLALPLFSSSEPREAPKNKYYSIEWTLWDQFEVKGDMILKDYLEYFKKEHKLIVTMIAVDVVTLYSKYVNPAKMKERENMKLTQIYESIRKEPLSKQVKHLTLTIACNDLNDDDVDVPPVRYVL